MVLKKLFKWFKKGKAATGPKIIARAQHNISRTSISNNALKVLYRLHKAGFAAYLVGGCIRDLLLDKNPKDFDIATNAKPEQLQDLFYNCRLIGRRFRLAHIHFGREIIEVATFRAHNADALLQNMHGMILRDNVYGTIEQDVWRRDFTINALYYNIADFSVVDFVDGMRDLEKKQLNLIGDPELRYREDPVRMLRAIRFAAKLGFTIHSRTAMPIFTLGPLLANIPAARIYEEYTKLFLLGHAGDTYKLLCEYGLFKLLFPRAAVFTDDSLIVAALRSTDLRIKADKSVAPGFLLAVFGWQALLEQYGLNLAAGQSEYMAFNDAMEKIVREQQRIMAVPRRLVNVVYDIWTAQQRLERRKSVRQIESTFALSNFRAAYDFLLLRADIADKNAIHAAQWWKNYVDGDEATRKKLVTKIKQPKRKIKKKEI